MKSTQLFRRFLYHYARVTEEKLLGHSVFLIIAAFIPFR